MNTATQFWRDPAMPHVESRRACRSRACYRPHSHPTASIGAVDQGFSLFTGAAGATQVKLAPGTLVFIPAGQVHACNPLPDAHWSYQMLHLDAAWLRALQHESHTGRTGNPGAPPLGAGPFSAIIPAPHGADGQPAAESVTILHDRQHYTAFCRLNTLLFSASANTQDKDAALIAFLGDCGQATGHAVHAPAAPAALAARLGPVMAFLQQTPQQDATLAQLASLAGMSRYQLIRTFHAITGLTPHAWQLNRRINLARDWLRDGKSLAQTAHELGFADQAHFQRMFKAHTGATPGTYRG